jgi:hypothetical protein
MAKLKWVPGPWLARDNGVCWQIDAAQDAVATTQFCYARETAANARLIAAAPELYEALSKLANEVAGICELAEAAIREGAGHTNYSVLWQRQAEATLALAKARGEP